MTEELSLLRRRYERWVATQEAADADLVDYDCPQCHAGLRTHRPAEGDTYDSLARCPYCGHLHFRAVHDDGRVAFDRQGAA